MARNRKIKLSRDVSVTPRQHDTLLAFLKKRLDVAKVHRDSRACGYEVIDRQLAGYLKLSPEDRKRAKEAAVGASLKPHDVSLQTALVQLDEALTFLMAALAPDDGIYKALAAKEEQPAAKAFALLMNEHAELYDHYTNMAVCILDQLKYNEGGLRTTWMKEHTPIVGTELGLQDLKVEDALDTVAGNQLTALDMYNTLYDVAVPVERLSREGEFVAWVDMLTPHRVDKLADSGVLTGIERFMSYSIDTEYTVDGSSEYYKQKPIIKTYENGGDASSEDWLSIITETATGANNTSAGVELVTIAIWLKPSMFGLVSAKSAQFTLWQFTIAQGDYIVDARPLDNLHRELPVSIGRIWNDGFKGQTSSYAEMLLPFQRFASYQLNVHTRSQRKKLYGLTVFDKKIFPDLDQATTEGGLYGTNGATAIKNIRDHIAQFNDVPDTSRTIQDIQNMGALMQDILPTQLDRQVAGLERATQYQAAAVVQAVNKRNLKIARIINSQTLTRVRHQMYWNILAYQPAVTLFDEQGNPVEVSPKELRSSKVKFALSDMLSGVDKLAILMNLKELLPNIIQSQAALERIDIVALLNYFTSLSGDKTDLTAFEYKHPLDSLPKDQKDVAMQLLQQAMQAQNDA